MKTNKKILETLLKIQEFVEAIADNQHRPNVYEYSYDARERHKESMDELRVTNSKFDTPSSNQVKDFVDAVNGESIKVDILIPKEDKPFPKYWWTYTEGLPQIIKDWFVENHKGVDKWLYDFDIIGNRSAGFFFMSHSSDYGECEYVSHKEIIDHYGLEEKEQPEKTYTKEEILEQYRKYHMDDEFLNGFGDWIRQNM